MRLCMSFRRLSAFPSRVVTVSLFFPPVLSGGGHLAVAGPSAQIRGLQAIRRARSPTLVVSPALLSRVLVVFSCLGFAFFSLFHLLMSPFPVLARHRSPGVAVSPRGSESGSQSSFSSQEALEGWPSPLAFFCLLSFTRLCCSFPVLLRSGSL